MAAATQHDASGARIGRRHLRNSAADITEDEHSADTCSLVWAFASFPLPSPRGTSEGGGRMVMVMASAGRAGMLVTGRGLIGCQCCE